MSTRRARRPLNPDAVRAANEAVYAQMDTRGEARRPLTMGSEDYEYRRLWMDTYLANLPPDQQGGQGGGGRREVGGDDVQPCEPGAGGGGAGDGGGGTPPPEAPAPAPAPGGTTPAPGTRYSLREVRWVTTEAYCGDRATFEAVVLGYPPASPAVIEVFRVAADGSRTTLQTINAELSGGRLDTAWDAKAPSADWRNDRIKFRFTVPAIGVGGESSNEFRFRQRPTTNWTRIDADHPCNGGFAPVVELHDARLEADRVHYAMKMKLTGIGLTAPRQQNMKRLIETPWNNGFANRRFHRTGCRRGRACDCQYDCCKAGFHLDFNIVTSGEHVSVEIRRPPDPTNPPQSAMGRTGGYIYEPPLDEASVYAHEIGHLLGQFDEYTGGGTDPSGVQPAPSPVPNLMATGLNTTLLTRHYRRVLAYLNRNTGGDAYEIIPP